MNKIHIAMYKGKGRIRDKIVDLFTGNLGYTHCELVITPQKTIGSHYLYKNGVQYFYYNNIYNNPRWDIYEVDGDLQVALKYARKQVGTPYDLAGVILYFIGLTYGDSRKGVWCSEYLAEVINRANKSKINTMIMPNILIKVLKKSFSAVHIVRYLNPKCKTITNCKEIDELGRIEA